MTYSNERLDRIEALLATVAESQTRTQSQLEVLAVELLATRQVTESNARAIEAWSSRIEEAVVEAEEVSSQTRADLAIRIEDAEHNREVDRQRFNQLYEEHAQRFNNLLEEARADRQNSEQRYREWQQRFDQQNQDWQQRFDQQNQDWQQRFDQTMVANAQEHQDWQQRFDQAMAANAQEHRAFTQNVQVLLAEIARIWQRLAG